MDKITVTMKYTKATRNCLVFAEETANEFAMAKIGSLYIQKSVFGEEYAGGDIDVTLSIAENNAEITFSSAEAKKSCVMFAEDVPNEFALAKIGKLYVPKPTLAEIAWQPGQKLAIAIAAK